MQVCTMCFLGASLVPPWCLLGASLVHPWCFLGWFCCFPSLQLKKHLGSIFVNVHVFAGEMPYICAGLRDVARPERYSSQIDGIFQPMFWGMFQPMLMFWGIFQPIMFFLINCIYLCCIDSPTPRSKQHTQSKSSQDTLECKMHAIETPHLCMLVVPIACRRCASFSS